MARRRIGFWYRVVVVVVKPLLLLFTKRDWRGMEHIPAQGGFVTAVNHISYVDPLTYAHFQYESGREAHFLAKSSLFRIPVVGRIIRGAGQIPVFRDSADAALAFRSAVEAVNRGDCVAVYPEGTITRDKALWPMSGKTGAARIALTTGAPVIPIAQWGAQDILPPYGKRPRLFPRKTMKVIAGPPVDLDEFRGRDLTAEVLRGATDRIMDAVTELLSKLREEPAPPRSARRKAANGDARATPEPPADSDASDDAAATAPAETPANTGDAAAKSADSAPATRPTTPDARTKSAEPAPAVEPATSPSVVAPANTGDTAAQSAPSASATASANTGDATPAARPDGAADSAASGTPAPADAAARTADEPVVPSRADGRAAEGGAA
ncbi:lysophospholipid acyltransferase family protein [Yinghuangia sp. ASG 101]|uniref:lysophospholipid acyltransferase family protein n=1 Tax=Yinghuangia sp. ASG 101 TaxID=2896848 RepID=UPI003FCE880B